MIIKTITCHDVYNYGSSLQAYALMTYLESLGHCVEIIDYKPDYLTQRYNLWVVSAKVPNSLFIKIVYFTIKIPGRLLKYCRCFSRKKAFDEFRDRYLKLTTEAFHSNNELRLAPPPADIYFTGSDQVWNTMYPNGKDPSFYLDFAPRATVKASYAASFSVNYIENGYVEQVKSWLNALDYISVRERTGLSILKSINMKGVQVMDPVFLLPAADWEKMATEGQVKGKYILIYDFENNPNLARFAKDISNKTGYQIISIKDNVTLRYAHRNICDASPSDFLGLIRNCQIFISNSFHGTAFSIIFNKEFYTFESIYQKVNSRMKDLLCDLELEDRLIVDKSKTNIANKINYNKVNDLLYEKVTLSKNYIKQVCASSK